MTTFCVGCSRDFRKGEETRKSLVYGATKDMRLCARCFSYEERRTAKCNEQSELLRSYRRSMENYEVRKETERQLREKEELKQKIGAFWDAVLGGNITFEIPRLALLNKTEQGGQFIEIRCHDMKPDLEVVETGDEPNGKWLKVFLPSSAMVGDTIRIVRPSQSGRSFIANIIEYARQEA